MDTGGGVQGPWGHLAQPFLGLKGVRHLLGLLGPKEAKNRGRAGNCP